MMSSIVFVGTAERDGQPLEVIGNGMEGQQYNWMLGMILFLVLEKTEMENAWLERLLTTVFITHAILLEHFIQHKSRYHGRGPTPSWISDIHGNSNMFPAVLQLQIQRHDLGRQQ